MLNLHEANDGEGVRNACGGVLGIVEIGQSAKFLKREGCGSALFGVSRVATQAPALGKLDELPPPYTLSVLKGRLVRGRAETQLPVVGGGEAFPTVKALVPSERALGGNFSLVSRRHVDFP